MAIFIIFEDNETLKKIIYLNNLRLEQKLKLHWFVFMPNCGGYFE